MEQMGDWDIEYANGEVRFVARCSSVTSRAFSDIGEKLAAAIKDSKKAVFDMTQADTVNIDFVAGVIGSYRIGCKGADPEKPAHSFVPDSLRPKVILSSREGPAAEQFKYVGKLFELVYQSDS
jgi:hypothetical protein